jgi:DNA polymerase IV
MPDLARFRAKHDVAVASTSETAACILHVDMDAFFVSVELLERPELRGKPVVVGGRSDQRGVVTAASYEARKYGIQSAMPLRTAGRLCPHAIFLDGHHAKYTEWSDRVASILAQFSPAVEMVSIDEAYLDLTGTERLHGPPLAAADKLLRTITRSTCLPCSGGLASTRLVAKVASDQGKPRGLVWIPAGREERFLAPLPVRKIPGIGKVTEKALRALGIETVEQIAVLSQEKLEKIFGRWGTALYRKARGGDSYEFVVDAEPKSISQNHTFNEDTNDSSALTAALSDLSQKACKRLREAGLAARTLTLTIRYQGFDTHTRSKTLRESTFLDPSINAIFRDLFHTHRDRSRKVRLLGVSLSGFTHGAEQLDLLQAQQREKLQKVTLAADKLRDRFGFNKVQFGGSLQRNDTPPEDR